MPHSEGKLLLMSFSLLVGTAWSIEMNDLQVSVEDFSLAKVRLGTEP